MRRLIGFRDALQRVQEVAKRLRPKIEYVSLLDALGRVCAKSVHAKVSAPPADRSEVDGYAVIASDVTEASEMHPVRLQVVGAVPIGKVPKVRVQSGSCVRVATGSYLPEGADAVVPLEWTRERGSWIEVVKPVAQGQHVTPRGSDVPEGSTVVETGRRIGLAELARLSAAGVGKVPVYHSPRVAVISIGGELVPPGRQLPPGRVYDVNAQTLYAMVQADGGRPAIHRIYSDAYEHIESAVHQATLRYNIVITSGATSVGETDVLPDILRDLGQLLFYGVRVKPGKPTALAWVERCPVVALPGNPFSCAVAYALYARPLVRRLSGLPFTEPRIYPTAQPLRGEAGKTLLYPVQLLGGKAHPFEIRSPLARLIQAEGVAEVPEGSLLVEEAPVWPLHAP